jgi:hypothetical protein
MGEVTCADPERNEKINKDRSKCVFIGAESWIASKSVRYLLIWKGLDGFCSLYFVFYVVNGSFSERIFKNSTVNLN